MSRVAYVGGVASGPSATARVGNALGAYFETVEVFTFSDYVNSPEPVLKAAKGATLLTHSAGAVAAPMTEARHAYLLNPPVPRHVGGLAIRALVKVGRMYMPGLGIHNVQDFRNAREFSKDSGAEMLAHPRANLSQIPRISRYDAVDAAIFLQGMGIASNLIWTRSDMYFRPSEDDLLLAGEHEIPITILEGQHDEVVLHPAEFLQQVFNG